MVSWPRAGVGNLERLFASTVQGVWFYWTVDAEWRAECQVKLTVGTKYNCFVYRRSVFRIMQGSV